MKQTRFFTIFQYDREEQYLMEQHRQGQAFKSIPFITRYEFEATAPAEFVYKLEYTDLIDNINEYTAFLESYGWEYIDTYFSFSYFRKPGKPEQKNELFSSSESKLEHLNKIVINRGLAFVLALFIMVIVAMDHPLGQFLLVVLVLLGIWLVFDFLRIRKKINENEF